MSSYQIYALRVDPSITKMVTESLSIKGEGRFGWSYVPTADLKSLKKRVEEKGFQSLSLEERDCYQVFLLDFKPDDYVIYINVPDYGKCTLAKITGTYLWRWEDNDFNHRFPVDPSSIHSFDRNDAAVHPWLSARLKLQGRYWKIYNTKEFEDLLIAVNEGRLGTRRTPKTHLELLANEIRPHLLNITQEIQHTHHNTDLEHLLVEVFKSVPSVRNTEHKGGAGDHGADILIDYDEGLPGLLEQRTCVVQVKSFTGEHSDLKAVNDIERAFKFYADAHTGLIISSAVTVSDSVKQAIDQLSKNTGKVIGLMYGADLAAFFLKYGQNLLG
jgi:hypothetical protein